MAESKFVEFITQLQIVLYQAQTAAYYLAKETDAAGVKPGKDVMQRISTTASLVDSIIGNAVRLAEAAY